MTERALWMITLAYCVLAGLVYVLLPVRRAAVVSYLGGWLLLPVAAFPPGARGFTVDLIGGALPAPDMLVAKAWIAPVVTLALALVAAPRRVLALRPTPLDLSVALWCAWPLLLSPWVVEAAPRPMVASLYLAGSWGAPWLLGRLFLADGEGRRTLIDGLATAGLLMIPAALIEWIARPVFYPLLYGAHPFIDDGVRRYVGFRPLLLLEDGNQYGMTIAMAALAGIAARRWAPGRFATVRAAVLVAAAVLAQSVGALILLAIGAALVEGWASRPTQRRVLLAAGVALALAAPIYLSGVVPVERLVRHTAPGQRLLAAVRATGRGSIAWRVSQDQKVLPLLRAHPVAGASRWDWWRPAGTRPWSLALLIVGQFGALGLLLAFMPLGLPWIRSVAGQPVEPASAALAIIAALTAADALLNAFVFLPAIVAAGAAAGAFSESRPLDTGFGSAHHDSR